MKSFQKFHREFQVHHNSYNFSNSRMPGVMSIQL